MFTVSFLFTQVKITHSLGDMNGRIEIHNIFCCMELCTSNHVRVYAMLSAGEGLGSEAGIKMEEEKRTPQHAMTKFSTDVWPGAVVPFSVESTFSKCYCTSYRAIRMDARMCKKIPATSRSIILLLWNVVVHMILCRNCK